ncbi:SGNH/GDSL hydrolase family protein [Streptomyces sp. NPDC054796]
MRDSHPVGTGTGAGRRRRVRAVALGAFAAVLAGGIALAAFGGAGDGGGQETRQGPGGRQPSASPSPTPVWDRHPESLAAVGDSITRGFDACSLLADCTRVSWATGSDTGVDSLAGRLLDDPSGDSWNYARSGSVMADLPRQMKRAAGREPDMVTVMSGANDACQPTVARMTSVDDYRESFREAMRTLRKESPKTQVYVASVPDLKRLWSEGRANPMGERIWRLGICQSMLRDAKSVTEAAEERRQEVYERVVAYNRVLEQECAEDLRCRYDGGAVFSYRFTETELSDWDWFHPSKQGQRKLAELAYREIVAPNEG